MRTQNLRLETDNNVSINNLIIDVLSKPNEAQLKHERSLKVLKLS